MLIIRRDQVEMFSRAAVERFEKDLLADLRRNYPSEFGRLGEAGVLELIRNAVKRAATYGISGEIDLATMSELDLSFGAPFERQKGCEWAGAILTDRSLTPGGRLVLIMERLEKH